ncbi:MAG TPA: hypothetical protein VK522_04495 [Pseudolabrys sp.]|jgi:hypothetical protein|nr:hypothetical protein [Pseudolabrys sp.]
MSAAEHFLVTTRTSFPASSVQAMSIQAMPIQAMPDERARRRRIKKEQLAELKDTAITKLERRGYEVRGKTPAQIRQILRRHPTKPLSIGT